MFPLDALRQSWKVQGIGIKSREICLTMQGKKQCEKKSGPSVVFIHCNSTKQMTKEMLSTFRVNIIMSSTREVLQIVHSNFRCCFIPVADLTVDQHLGPSRD